MSGTRWLLMPLLTLWPLLAACSIPAFSLAPRETTEFYMLDPQGTTGAYPESASPGDEIQVTLGIVNRERDQLEYRVEIWMASRENPEQKTALATYPTFILQPGQQMEWAAVWTMPPGSRDVRVEFLLFRGGDSRAYRQLHLLLESPHL